MPIRTKEMHQDVIYAVPMSPCKKVYAGEKAALWAKDLMNTRPLSETSALRGVALWTTASLVAAHVGHILKSHS